MIVALACVAASFERLRRVHRAAAFDFAELSAALGRNPDGARVSLMHDLLVEQGPGWEGELLREIIDAKSRAERTALVNERLGDVESDLGWGSRIPVVAARLAALGPLCVLFFGLALRDRLALSDIVAIVGWGASGVIGALAAASFYVSDPAELAGPLTVAGGLAQIGEFSFIVGAMAKALGMMPDTGNNVLIAGAITWMSRIFSCSILIKPAYFLPG